MLCVICMEIPSGGLCPTQHEQLHYHYSLVTFIRSLYSGNKGV